MARKQMHECGTKNKIIEIAMPIFFEKGYEAASIRSIMKATGADVGTFYYYFDTKDALFEEVLTHFFEGYRAAFEELVKKADEIPERALMRLFNCLIDAVKSFRENYGENLHCTIKWAIRERTLTLLEPYIEETIRILVRHGAKPRFDISLTATFLSHGIGSIVTHEDEGKIAEVYDELRKIVNTVMGLDEAQARIMFEE